MSSKVKFFFFLSFFLFITMLHAIIPIDMSQALYAIDKEENSFLEGLYKEKKAYKQAKKKAFIKEKAIEENIGLLQESEEYTFELQALLDKQKKKLKDEDEKLKEKKNRFLKEAKERKKVYLALEKELEEITRERKKRKEILAGLKSDALETLEIERIDTSNEEARIKKEALVFFNRGEEKRLLELKKKKILAKAKEKEKKKQAYLKKQKALAKAKLKKEKLQKAKARKAKAKIPRKNAKILARVSISRQRMEVFRDNILLYKWKVSTARKGYRTPKGNYKAKAIKKMHYSSLYNNSPMPYTIFYSGNYAIHGTSHNKRLGRPASHGCVRLRTSNAKKLYTLARKYGRKNVYIQIKR